MTMVFLISSAVGVPIKVKSQEICGINHQPDADTILAVADSVGLRNLDAQAEQVFADQVRQAFAKDQSRIAGLVEVFGGHFVDEGEALAAGASDSLKYVGIIFSVQQTLVQKFWSGNLNNNQIEMIVFYYQIASNCQST